MIKIKTVVSLLWHTWQNKNNNCFEFKNLWDTSTPKLEILLVQWLCTSSTLCFAFSYYYLQLEAYVCTSQECCALFHTKYYFSLYRVYTGSCWESM